MSLLQTHPRIPLAALIAVLMHCGCDRAGGAGGAASSSPLPKAFLVASGDTAGWLTPCGCTSNQSGGLSRPGTYLAGLRKSAEVLYVDVGGAATPRVSGAPEASAYEQARFEAILEGEMHMGLAAHNLGMGEIELGPEVIRRISAQMRVPFLSANARDGSGKRLVAPGLVVKAAGRNIALIGVASPRYSTAKIHLEQPRTAILAALDELSETHDAVVVLAYLPEDELRQLAIDLPEVDVILGGPTGQAVPPQQIGAALLAAATNKGKFLAELAIAADSHSAWTGQIVEMRPDIADDMDQQANLTRYLQRLEKADYASADTGLAAAPIDVPAGYRFVGDQSCVWCHAPEVEKLSSSKHAQAWQALKSRGYHVDSSCQKCHVTGFGQPGGFVSVAHSPAFVNVGCESCHGPSAAHAQDPKIKTPFQAGDQCIRCHDRENSPAFDFKAFFAKIKHGERVRVVPRGIVEAPREDLP